MIKYVLSLDSNNRITCPSKVLHNGKYEGMPIVDTLPDGEPSDYLYIDGQYVYDPLPVPEEPEIPDTPAEEEDVWAALDAAYQEGVDSV